MNKNILLVFVCALFLLTSCKTKERPSELNYMQNIEETISTAALQNSVSTIQKGDLLLIFVSAKNMDVVKPFNQGYYSGQMQTPSTTTTGNTEKAYIVDSNGDIDFPVLGKINTINKSLEKLKDELTERTSQYVKDPTVIVKLANFKVTVLGEVARPGQYTIPEANSNLLNAIGLAGDLTMYAKRDDLLLVRNENGVLSKTRINLMNSDFVNSPYFQLKQGDVIYVSGNQTKEKISRLDPNTSVFIAIAGTIIGLAGIFITIFKK